MTVQMELTKNQKLVFETLEKDEAPLSAYTILDRLRDDGLRAPLQVYRALKTLQELGLVHKLESLNAFVACAHPDCHAHSTIAFAICEICGKVDEFPAAKAEESLSVWAMQNHFIPSKMVIEIRGKCAPCNTSSSTSV